MLSAPPAGDDGLPLNSRSSTWERVMSMGMGAIMVMMRMWMWKKKHRRPIMDQHRIYRTEGILLETEGIVLESVNIGQYISDL